MSGDISHDLLNRLQINDWLKKEMEDFSYDLTVLASTDSTNAHLLREMGDRMEADQYRICLAERQTAGRGRAGRRWISPMAANLYLSIACPFDRLELAGLSLAVGVAILKALDELGCSDVGVKWPNDIYWRHAKLGGVLIEVRSFAGFVTAVVGVGINYRMPREEAVHIDQPYADLSMVNVSPMPSRNLVAMMLIKHLLIAAKCFRDEGFLPFRTFWQERHVFHGRKVFLLRDHEVITGVVRGVTDQGWILLQHESGEILPYASGDVSLRPASS